MNKRKQYEYPSMIVITLSVKDGLMDYQSQDPAGVRGYRGYRSQRGELDSDEE